MPKDKQSISMLSIATKAGKVISGSFMCEKAIQDQSAFLIIIAEDASDNTQKKFKDKCSFYNVPCRICCESNILGNLIGKKDRMVVGVIDEGIANQIINKIDG